MIVALMLLLVLTIVGISSISTTTFESIITGNERLANTAFYSAEAGIHVGMNQIPVCRSDGDFQDEDWTDHIGHVL